MDVNRRDQRLLAAALGSPGARQDVEHALALTPIMPDEAARMRRFFRDVSAERGRQLDKWGDQHHDDGTNLLNDGWRDHARSLCQRAAAEGRVTWAHILQEEFTEAMAEVDADRLRAEIVQVAAVCAAWVSDIDQRAERSVVDWLIYSHDHNAWWKPRHLGYTTNVAFAGRYSQEEALKICEDTAFGWREGAPPPEVMVRADSPDLADAVAMASQRAIELRRTNATTGTEEAHDGTGH